MGSWCRLGRVQVWVACALLLGPQRAAAGGSDSERTTAPTGPEATATDHDPSALIWRDQDPGLGRRRARLVRDFVRDLAVHGIGDEVAPPSSRSIRRIAAGLFALQHPQTETDGCPGLRDLPKRVERFLARIETVGKLGTDGTGVRGSHGDYDFVAKELVSLLYRFQQAPALLSDDAAHHIVTRGLASLAGQRMGQELMFGAGFPIVGRVLRYPETENHVLMILSSAYLTNQWVLDNPRADVRLRRGAFAQLARYRAAADEAEMLLLDACARILRNGFWEANARPYQGMSVHALMNLQAYADSPRLRTAAHNALDYLATKFAFQSLAHRRLGPYRRSVHNVQRVDPYANDAVPFIFDTLVGGAAWPAGFIGVGNAAGHALWASLLDYRVPPAIAAHMRDQTSTYWARMMTRFSPGDYRIGRAPAYREAGSGVLEFVPELYFRGPGFLLSAGGRYNRYPIAGDTLVPTAGAHDSDFLSRPTSLLTRHHVGRLRSQADLDAQVLNMPGQAQHWKSDNLGVYKGFAYGYRHDGGDRHLQWPCSLPALYRAHLLREGRRSEFAWPGSRGVFSFVDLTGVPEAGFYLVLGRVSKSAHGAAFRDYARGFWEVVPAQRFASVQALKRYVMDNNPERHFQDGHDRHALHYRYRMTTGETLELNARLGAKARGCRNAIRAIWPADADPERSAPLPLSALLVDGCDADSVRAMPLLDVRQLGNDHALPGLRVALAPGDGQLSVEHPGTGARLYLDSRDPRHPSRRERSPTWQP